MSGEVKREFDRPLHFVHLCGRKRTDFSDNNGLLDDGDPLRLNHRARLEPGLREDGVLRVQGNPGSSRWLRWAGEDSDDGQVISASCQDDRRPEFRCAEIGDGESEEYYD